MQTRVHGWTVVATAATGLLFGAFPIVVFAFGVFFPAFADEFQAGRGAVSLAFTLHNFVSGLCAVAVGRLVDRVGARRVILPGLTAFAALLLAAESIGSRLVELYVFYVLLGVVAPSTTTVPYALVVSRWFDRRRGLALGGMMVGLGAGAVIMPVVAQRLIAAIGWRHAFASVGAAVLLVAVPLVGRFLQESPEPRGPRPDGPGAAAIEGPTWPQVRRDLMFWRLIAAFVLLAASVHACIVHLPQVFADGGATPAQAARASAVVGLALLVGRIGCGYVLDRVFAGRVALAVCAAAAVGVALLGTGGGSLALAGAFLVGLGMGAEVDIIAFLMSRYFGMRSLGATLGASFGAFVVAGGVGPLLMGLAFDRTGSYGAALVGFGALSTVAALLVARLAPYRFEVQP